jgi:hypothetical protein
MLNELTTQDTSVLSPKFVSKVGCHPERRLARILRQSQSKNLRLRPQIMR